MIFVAVCKLKFNCYCKIYKMQSSNCGAMFSDTSQRFQVNIRFQVKLLLNLSKGQAQSIQIYRIVLQQCC